MPSSNVFNELCVKITAKIYSEKNLTLEEGGYVFRLLPVMHRSDAYYATSYSRGIRGLPSSEVCRMITWVHIYKPSTRKSFVLFPKIF